MYALRNKIGATYNGDYDFVTLFDTKSIIHKESTSFDTLFDAVRNSWSKKEFAKILMSGVDSHFETTKDFKFISKFHDSLKNELPSIYNTTERNTHKHSKQHNDQSNDKNVIQSQQSNYNYNRVFNIQSLSCTVFQYLDFNSFIKCHQINLQWLYDCYQPSSVAYLSLDTNDLFFDGESYANKNCGRGGNIQRTKTHPIFHNISRFKSISSLRVCPGGGKQFEQNAEYLSELNQFTKVSRLTVSYVENLLSPDSNTFSCVLANLIENNKDNLKCIRIRGNIQCLEKIESITHFPKLNTLHVSDLAFKNTAHACETVILDNCQLPSIVN